MSTPEERSDIIPPMRPDTVFRSRHAFFHRSFFRSIVFALVCCLFLTAPVQVDAKPELVVCSDPWPPIAFLPGDAIEGYGIEVMRRIFEPLGYEVRYLGGPWTRCIRETREGIASAIIGCYVKEVPGFHVPEEPLGETRQTFFTVASSTWNYSSPESLNGIILGAIQDYSYGEELDAVFAKEGRDLRIVRLTGTDSLSRLIDMLRSGRIDAIVESRMVMDFTLSHKGLAPDSLRVAGQATECPPFYAAFSPTLPESRGLANAFDRGIRALRASGELKAILDVYGLVDWKSASGALLLPSAR